MRPDQTSPAIQAGGARRAPGEALETIEMVTRMFERTPRSPCSRRHPRIPIRVRHLPPALGDGQRVVKSRASLSGSPDMKSRSSCLALAALPSSEHHRLVTLVDRSTVTTEHATTLADEFCCFNEQLSIQYHGIPFSDDTKAISGPVSIDV
jgi:hypothetical protein